jgi:hypothetical protein
VVVKRTSVRLIVHILDLVACCLNLCHQKNSSRSKESRVNGNFSRK